MMSKMMTKILAAVSSLALVVLAAGLPVVSAASGGGGGGGGGGIITSSSSSSSSDDSSDSDSSEPTNVTTEEYTVADGAPSEDTDVVSEEGDAKLTIPKGVEVTTESETISVSSVSPDSWWDNHPNFVAVGNVVPGVTQMLGGLQVSAHATYSDWVWLEIPLAGGCPKTGGVGVVWIGESETEVLDQVENAITCLDGVVKFRVKKTSEFVVFADASVAASPFLDVVDHWALEYVEDLRTRSIVKGKSETSFGVDDSITRAELTKIALLAFGVEVDASVTVSGFNDGDGDWYTPYLAAAKEAGIVSGYEGEVFKPNAEINRAEALKILLGASGRDLATDMVAMFSDLVEGEWYLPYVNWAYGNGIIRGYSEGSMAGKFGVDRSITRGEIAKIASLLINM